MPSPFGSLLLLLAPLLALLVAPRLDAVSAIMLALVTFIAGVIHAYSRRYLDGQSAARHYQRWFLVTVVASSVLVTAGDLRVMALAWTASSLSLHQLLTFFADRPAAQVAAHKKFLLSRLADVAIYAAVFLIGRSVGTYDLAAVGQQAASLAAVPTGLHAAGFLLVAGVALRSAQLPFHGWLIQVMEAPTPVSALLHAGVVNIGGYVLIRLAGLIGILPGAQLALVLIGGTTAVLAALVMMTRVSIKVSLAWSTAAQMGFMLLECGLGAWELALLHLVAHSCYKAHAFLGSGSVVATQVQRQLAAPRARPTALRWVGATTGGVLVAAVAGWLAWPNVMVDPRAWIAVALLAVALAPIFLRLEGALGARTNLSLVGLAVGVAICYASWHVAFAAILPPVATVPSTAVIAFALGAFATLFLVQVLVSVHPHHRGTRALQAWAFAGFHLDELFTRVTFLVWPPRHVRRAVSALPAALPARLGRAA
jgi:NAD(P)H-quinone oxidoreductase subunit 5